MLFTTACYTSALYEGNICGQISCENIVLIYSENGQTGAGTGGSAVFGSDLACRMYDCMHVFVLLVCTQVHPQDPSLCMHCVDMQARASRPGFWCLCTFLITWGCYVLAACVKYLYACHRSQRVCRRSCIMHTTPSYPSFEANPALML